MPIQEYDAGPLDGLDDLAMREIDVGGDKVLVTRDGARLFAVSGVCPHARAPLAEGVRHRGRVICPWHKAAFCLRTGALLEPPAVDPLDCFDVRVDAGRVMVSRRERTAAEMPTSDERCFVIVGGGAAGAMAAQTLRQEGFGGRLIMLDRENRVPYDRTVLSKYTLSGATGAEKTPLQTQAFYKKQRIERVTAEVVGLDTLRHLVMCASGSSYRYDALLLATGGIATTPDLPGETLAGVFVLRSRGDAEAIVAQAERSERAVVLGTGFIGMEVAAALRERGLEVTVVGKESIPFENQLGVEIGGALKSFHEDKGVRFRLGRAVSALQGQGAVRSVILDDGEEIKADLVVAGLGVRPATGFLRDLAVNDDGSLSVNDRMQVADGVYAAGDIARFPYWGDGSAIRVEHWRVAQQHGRIAALNMLERETRYIATPVFWTIQYMKRVDYIGHAVDWDEVVIHGDLSKPEFLAYYVKDGRVAAAAGMGRDEHTAALGVLFDLRRDWTAAELGERPAALLASLAGNGEGDA